MARRFLRVRVERRVRLPDRKPIHPKQDDGLKRRSNEKINRTPCVTAHRDMVDRSIYVRWKEQYERSCSNPSSQSPRLWRQETSSDCQFQAPRQIHEKHPLRDPGGQHLRHGFGLNEVSDTREDEQNASPDRGSAPIIDITMRDG